MTLALCVQSIPCGGLAVPSYVVPPISRVLTSELPVPARRGERACIRTHPTDTHTAYRLAAVTC